MYRKPIPRAETLGLSPQVHNENRPAKKDSLQPRGCAYSLMWRKKTLKIHKTWEGDGEGYVVPSSTGTGHNFVVKADGLQLASIRLDLAKAPLEEGQVLSGGRYEFEIGALIARPKSSPSLDTVPPSSHAQPATNNLPNTRPASAYKSPNLAAGLAANGRKRPPPALGLTPLVGQLGAPLVLDAFVPLRPSTQVSKRIKASDAGGDSSGMHIDTALLDVLRPHQLEAVRFLHDSVLGRKHSYGHGAILADEMGLGKSLTAIALIESLVRGRHVRNALVVCPVTLLNNWKAEFRKWLPRGSQIGVMVVDQKGLGNGSLKNPVHTFFGDRNFRTYQILIVGYERTRLLSAQLIDEDKQFDLVVCDEGHKLKTSGSKTTEAIANISDDRRVILTGTPIQNNLNEFWALAEFVNPGCFGTEAKFGRKFVSRICSETNRQDAEAALDELSEICDEFMLRRDTSVLAKYLDVPKTEYAVFCRPTPAQSHSYAALTSGASQMLDSGSANMMDSGACLQAITELKKAASGLAHDGGGKLKFLRELIVAMRKGEEKLVIVSGSTKVLDLCQELCATLRVQWLRLDGQTPQDRRQGMVDKFNKKPADAAFAFLLSSRSGGMGLNLVGGSRLVLVDCDWNPSIDAQAMARIHRDGQKRACHIYRLLTVGTIDEKIFQRQLSKIGLSTNLLVEAGLNKSTPQFTREQLLDLFTFSTPPLCNTIETAESQSLKGYSQCTVEEDLLSVAIRSSKVVSCVLVKT